MAKVALITGVTGQDGSYLAEFLIKQGYEVHGVVRRTSSFATGRIDHMRKGFGAGPSPLQLHYGDLGDGTGLRRIIEQVRPDEVYNLAAQSHVRISFDQPEYTADVVGLGALRLLEALRDHNKRRGRAARLYQAGSSEMYGKVVEIPQRETTPFHPRSPYACAKVYAHYQTVNYREAYGLYACNGILFNHESPRRGETFVTRKITRGLTRIHQGLEHCLYLGNLDSRRDWGHARDYVRAQWLMLQQDPAEDFVIATGKQSSVRDFVVQAGKVLGMDIEWRGRGVDEAGVDRSSGRTIVRVDPRYFRPAEVESLLGDAGKIRGRLGWKPEISVDALGREMIDSG